jgi:magnesium transporter
MRRRGAARLDTAADHLVRRVAIARPQDTVDEVLARLRSGTYDCLENVHLLDEVGRLVGLVPLTRLAGAAVGTHMAELQEATLQAVPPGLDQEHLFWWARQHKSAAPPVVDADGRLLGCVPPRALVEIGWREHAEDMNRLAGILHHRNHDAHALERPPWRRALGRLPWLVVGLAGSAVATLVMAQFETALSAQIAVAFFVPAIVYLADAIGTQTEAVVVRALSFLSPAQLPRLVLGEIFVGVLIGAALGAVALPLVYAGFGDWRLAAAVAVSVTIAGSLATGCGLVFPWLLARVGLDPAFGSGPVATVIQDVLSLLIYFAVASAVMSL